jgi:uncharacterized lipoprotein
MTKTFKTMLGVAVALAVAGCHSGGNVCEKPGIYTLAQSVPPLRIPVGLQTPDTRQALRIPELNVPEPPPRRKGDACLDEPPKYTTPSGPKPAPAT